MRKYLLLLLFLCAALNTGCIEKKVSTVSYRDYIVYNIGEIPDSLIFFNEGTRDRELALNLFSGLVKKDSEGKIEPALADSWSVSKDGMTYTFRLKRDLQWSSGKKITSGDYLAFFSEILKEKSKNSNGDRLDIVYGVRDYREGKNSFDAAAIKAPDDSTLEFRLNYPDNLFLEILSQPEFALKNINSSLENWKKEYKNIDFTGPFIISDIGLDNVITLQKNLNYYDFYKVASDKILITCETVEESAMAGFYSGKIDMLENPPFTELEALKESNKLNLKEYNCIGSLFFNLKKEKEEKYVFFRQAVNKALDREYLCKTIFQGFLKPAGSSIFSNEALEKPAEEDMEAIKKKLQTDGSGKGKLTLIYEHSLKNKKICDYISSRLKTVLNLKIQLCDYDAAGFREARAMGSYDMVLNEDTFSFDDPSAYLELWATYKESNISGYKNYDYDKALDKLEHENSTSEREKLIKDCEEILKKDYPFIPLYLNNDLLAQSEDVSGVEITERGDLDFEAAYLMNKKVIQNKE